MIYFKVLLFTRRSGWAGSVWFFYGFFFLPHLSCVSWCWVGSRPELGGNGEDHWTLRSTGIFLDVGVVWRLTDEHQAQRYKLRRGTVVDLACMKTVFGFYCLGRSFAAVLTFTCAYTLLCTGHDLYWCMLNISIHLFFVFFTSSLRRSCPGRCRGNGFLVDTCIHWETSVGRDVMCGGNEKSGRTAGERQLHVELGCLSTNNGCRYRHRWLLFWDMR